VARKKIEYTAQYTFADFLARYDSIVQPLNLESTRSDRQKVETFATISGLGIESLTLGRQHVFLADVVWKELEDSLRAVEKEERNLSKARDDESLASGYAGEERAARNTRAGSVERLIPRTKTAGYGSDYYDDTGSYVSEDEYYSRSGGTGHGEDEDGSFWGNEWKQGEGYVLTTGRSLSHVTSFSGIFSLPVDPQQVHATRRPQKGRKTKAARDRGGARH
jgi:chitin synthase